MPSGHYQRKPLSEETRRKISIKHIGMKHSVETKKKLSEISKKLGFKPPSRSGTKATSETKKKMSDSHKGERAYNYKGGVSRDTRSNYRYILWRTAIFERDNWTCQTCGARGKYIEPHHIKSWARYPDLRYDLDNGVTLCADCHKLTDNYRGKRPQLKKDEYINGKLIPFKE